MEKTLNSKLQKGFQSIAKKRSKLKSLKTAQRNLDQQINSLGAGVELHKSRQLGPKNYQEALEKVFSEYFCKIPQSRSVEVDLVFKGKLLTCHLRSNTTFADLSRFAARYWSLPFESVFFKESEDSPILLPSHNVIETLYTWYPFKLHSKKKLYLQKTQKLQSPVDLEPDKDCREEPEITQHMTHETTAIQSERNSSDKTNTLKTVLIIQTILAISLATSWAVLSISESTPSNFSLLASSILKITDQKLETLEFPSVYTQAKTQYNSLTQVYSKIAEIKKEIYFKSQANYELLDPIRLTQVKSKLYECPKSQFSGCAHEFSGRKEFTKDILQIEGFQHSKRPQSPNVRGYFGSYPLEGYTVYLPTNNYSLWDSKVNTLVANNWVDSRTRAVFISLDFAIPLSKFLASFVYFVEISPTGEFTENIEFHKFSYQNYSQSLVALHSLTAFLALLSIGVLWKKLSFSKANWNAYRSHLSILSLGKLTKLQKLKEAELKDLFQFLVYLSALVLLLAKFIWFESNLNPFSSTDNYFGVAKQSQTILSCFYAVFLLLIAVVLQFIATWKPKLLNLTSGQAFKEYLVVGLVFCLPFFGFMVSFMTLLGSYNGSFTGHTNCFLSVTSLFFGKLQSFHEFTPLSEPYGILLVLLFLFSRTLAVWHQIALLSMTN